jgi:hypothetical protein
MMRVSQEYDWRRALPGVRIPDVCLRFIYTLPALQRCPDHCISMCAQGKLPLESIESDIDILISI